MANFSKNQTINSSMVGIKKPVDMGTKTPALDYS